MLTAERLPLLKLAVTAGDVAGIGLEVALRALSAAEGHEVVLIGPANLIEIVADRFGVLLDRVAIIDTGRLDPALLFCGRPAGETGAASHDAVVRAAGMVINGEVDALVTAPISKTAWGLAGKMDPGHTELIGDLMESTPVMGFVGEEADGAELRVALATIHEAIRNLPALVTKNRVFAALGIFARDLERRFGIARPRIAVTGLNPHAGEAGKFGDEDESEIAPACRQARQQGIDATGPLPADAVFTPRMRRCFDGILAMYHDQGLAPFKALTAGSGVNVTLGLPIVRTSPDHGTAFDRAGRDGVDSSSMAAAIRLAIRLAGSRRE